MAWWRAKNKESYNKKRLAWAVENRERRSVQSRRSYLKVKFGLTPEEFTTLLKDQKHKCAICSYKFKVKGDKHFRKRMDAFVDHDHKNGKVRGLLCMNCNTGLGHFRDNSRLLQNAINYVER